MVCSNVADGIWRACGHPDAMQSCAVCRGRNSSQNRALNHSIPIKSQELQANRTLTIGGSVLPAYAELGEQILEYI